MEMFPLVSAAEDVVVGGGVSGALDSILNFVVPLAIFLMFGFMVYRNFQTDIDRLIVWIKKQFEEKEEPQALPINNPYMMDGTIIYR